jgi:hypothetical protein
MKKSFNVTVAEIHPVRKAHRAALAIWENVPMKRWQKPKIKLCNPLRKVIRQFEIISP